MRGGAYRLGESLTLDARDSGTPTRRSPGKRRGRGGRGSTAARRLPADAFRPVTDQKCSRGSIRRRAARCCRPTCGRWASRTSAAFPISFRGAPAVPELFFNDQRMTLARWPNEGWATIAKIIDSGSDPARRRQRRTGRASSSTPATGPARWNVDAGVWLQGYWCFDWYDEVIQVKAIDREKRQITLAAPHRLQRQAGQPLAAALPRAELLEELDQPGEFYIDRARGPALLLAARRRWPARGSCSPR